MAKADAPPKLNEILSFAKNISASLNRIDVISEEAPRIKIIVDEVIDKIELHIKAQQALFEAYMQLADAEKLAMEEFRRKSSEGGSGSVIFGVSRDLHKLGDQLQERYQHEATREPGDFR